MDRREEMQNERNLYQKELEQQENQDIDFSKQYIEENGSKFRVPYRDVKMIRFSDVSQVEMRDMEHAARLQYRLMLQDAVLKATVNFSRKTITVIFNPKSADNLKEKTGVEEIVAFLAKEGVHVSRAGAEEQDYDYISNFYNYAFNPKSIKEHPPNGYTKEEWARIKPEWEENARKSAQEKREKWRKFQENYDKHVEEIKNPEAAEARKREEEAMKNRSILDRILGRQGKKEEGKGQGFWFHGI